MYSSPANHIPANVHERLFPMSQVALLCLYALKRARLLFTRIMVKSKEDKFPGVLGQLKPTVSHAMSVQLNLMLIESPTSNVCEVLACERGYDSAVS